MPMDKEEFEQVMNQLNNPELTHTERTEVLDKLRSQHGQDLSDFSELSETKEKLEKDNQDLLHSNSLLFRKVGTQEDDELKKKEEEKNLSEEITVEQLQQNARSQAE